MIQIGIVGKSNTGKSAFFKAATLVDVEISNRIFTTIKPNQGVGYVIKDCPCRKLGVTCLPKNSKCINGKRLIPVKLIDIAGLVPGAHSGRGLGNKFLNDIMTATGLIHVVDASGGTDRDGNPVKAGTHDPEEDVHFLPHEIDQWMLQILAGSWPQIKKKSETTKEKLEDLVYRQLSGLQVDQETISSEIRENRITIHSSEGDLLRFISAVRHRNKPIMIAANKSDVAESKENIRQLREKHREIIPCSAESELALREAAGHKLISYFPGDGKFEITSEGLSGQQINALEFIKENVLERFGTTGVQDVLNKTAFELLDMIAVYPVASISKLSDKDGNILPDAHLVKRGTHLKGFAERIHSDLAEKFVGGLDTHKKKIGADYELKDGDVVEILVRK